jgi:hypothetical protein
MQFLKRKQTKVLLKTIGRKEVAESVAVALEVCGRFFSFFTILN